MRKMCRSIFTSGFEAQLVRQSHSPAKRQTFIDFATAVISSHFNGAKMALIFPVAVKSESKKKGTNTTNWWFQPP